MYQMTSRSSKNYSICIEEVDVTGAPIILVYQVFIMDSESVGYTYFTYGAAGSVDPMGPTNRKYKLTTKDRNNQECCCANKAISAKGAWWYSCTMSFTRATVALNGAGSAGFYYSVPPGATVPIKYSKMVMKAKP